MGILRPNVMIGRFKMPVRRGSIKSAADTNYRIDDITIDTLSPSEQHV
jgi:hypothetical protein